MRGWRRGVVLLFLAAVTANLRSEEPAQRPPMGWNSWDSYGLSVTDAEWRSNVDVLHTRLQRFGWNYAVLDEGWYLQHPEMAGGKGDQGYTLNSEGQYVAAPNRFPEGVAGLAAYAHGMGLKFGLHIIRGIPKGAVDRGLRIGKGGFAANEAADTTDLCRWNPDNYGIRDNAVGQAYYDGLMRLYASWGVDLLKVDCISAPYDAHEIRMLRHAIDAAGRPIVLSLSPGPTPLDRASDVRQNAQMWRISEDVWDVWSDPKLTQGTFPQTIVNQIEVLARWMPFEAPGHWPDADMLAVGELGPRPGWGDARRSRLTLEETRSVLTMWAIARSPLILGTNLQQMTAALERLLANREVLAVDQEGQHPRQVSTGGTVVVWRSEAPGGGSYVAIVAVGEGAQAVRLDWKDAGIAPGEHAVRDLWAGKDLGRQAAVTMTLPAHGAALLRVDGRP